MCGQGSVELKTGEIEGRDTVVFEAAQDTGPVTHGRVTGSIAAQNTNWVSSDGCLEDE